MPGTQQREKSSRRDFIVLAAGAMVAAGGTVSLWPFIDQMNPGAGQVPRDAVEVDLAPIKVGQMITVSWNGQPVLVRHRTATEIAKSRTIAVTALQDRFARNEALPERAHATDQNRTLVDHAQWLVVIGLCPHLACRLIEAAGAEVEGSVGFFCPCHAARFDHAGRVLSGPAQTNLPVPPYRFISGNRIRIGKG